MIDIPDEICYNIKDTMAYVGSVSYNAILHI